MRERLRTYSRLWLAGIGLTMISVMPAVGATRGVCKTGCTFTTIQSAINASRSGDTINIAAGTYAENLVIEGKTLTLIGAGQDLTVIDGRFLGPVLQLGAASSVSIPDFAYVTVYAVTITHGSNSGILINGGSLNLQNSILASNQSVLPYPASTQSGGGISATAAAVTIGSSMLIHNKSSVVGGALVASSESNVTITNSTISRNSSADAGAIFIYAESSVSVTGSTFSENTATGVEVANGLGSPGGYGGAVYVAGRDVIDHLPGGTFTVTSSTFTANTAAAGGGAIEGHVQLTNSVVARNHAALEGGGIEGGLYSSTNSFVIENVAGSDGGGLNIDLYSQSSVTVTDNTPDNCISIDGACPTS